MISDTSSLTKISGVTSTRCRLVANARWLKNLTDTLRVQKIWENCRILHVIQKCGKFDEEDNSENHRQKNSVIKSQQTPINETQNLEIS